MALISPILTAALALHLIVVGHAWGNARSHLPALVDLVHEFLIVRKTRSLKPFFLDSVLFFINVGILSAAFAAFITACAVVMALNLPVVFAPLWFLAVGFLSIAGGRGLAQIKLLSLENQKRALYRKLIYEIFLLTRIRRENENG